MHGKGVFHDPRLDDAEKYPVAARTRQGHKQDEEDLITAKLPALHFYQLSLPTPKPPEGTFDSAAAENGEALFNGKATCSTCHVPPIFTEPGWNLHTAEEIGIDDFQAMRSPDGRYVTTPLRALWNTEKIHKGGFYHDGRFATLGDVVNHYDNHLGLDLTDAETAFLSEPSHCDEEEADAAGAVSVGDGRGGALGAAAGSDRAALPEGGTEGRAPADAAGDDAAGLFSPELVCAQRPDGRGDALRQRGDAPVCRDRAGRRPHPGRDHHPQLPPSAGAARADRGDLRGCERAPGRQGHHAALGHAGRCDDHRRAVLDEEQGWDARPRDDLARRRATTGISA